MLDSYPEPEFPIGHVVYNRHDEPLTVVAHIRTDQIMAGGDRRLFSDEDARRTPWFYTLRDPKGAEHDSVGGALHHMEQMTESRRSPAPAELSPIPRTQLGRQESGTCLRSPLGVWTVVRTWYAHIEDRERCRYLLQHEDGREEEWWAFDMAAADFHRILPDEPQTIFGGDELTAA